MSDKSVSRVPAPESYAYQLAWRPEQLHSQSLQLGSLAAADRKLILPPYWQFDPGMQLRQAEQEWGAKLVGFSRTNLRYMRSFLNAWPNTGIAHTAYSTSWASAGRPASVKSKRRWLSTSSGFLDLGRALPSSSGQLIWKSAVTTSSSTNISFTSSYYC